MNIKLLPVKMPPIITFLHYSQSLEILLNYESYLPSFFMDYIQLNLNKNEHDRRETQSLEFFTIQTLTHLERIVISLDELVKQGINVCDFIVSRIKHEYYVRVNIDEYYIPNRTAYSQRHFNHSMQIHGYDLEKELFHISGFDKNRNYSFHTVEFVNLEKAVINNISEVRFYMYKYKKEKEAHCELDIHIIKTLLKQYINSQDSSKEFVIHPTLSHRFEKDLYWGMGIYNGLKLYIEHYHQNGNSYDIRPWHLLWEHKKTMLMRIKYLQEKGYIEKSNAIYDEYKCIEKNSLVLRNIFLKCEVTHSDIDIKKIFDFIDNISTKEYDAINKLLLQL